jgi:4a-hydroxytetrahydrobiopterin dehydratase
MPRLLSMALLGREEIDERLSGLDGWSLDGKTITKDYDNDDFKGSVAFVDAILPIAEGMGHHPDLAISWATVTVTITSHSEGGLTESDFDLAAKIDAERR